MLKKNLILLFAAMISLQVLAEEHEITLKKKPGNNTGSRTEVFINASIEEQLLSIVYGDLTSSSIVIYDATNTNAVVYDNNCTPAYNTQIDLENLSAGIYIIEIYAFNECWTGIFRIDNGDVSQ